MTDEFWQRASEAQEAAYALHHLLLVLNTESEPEGWGEGRICATVGNLAVRDERLRRAMDALYQTVKGEDEEGEQ